MTSGCLRYAISDRNLAGAPDEQGQFSSQNRTALLAQAAILASSGVDFFQLRERDLNARTLAELTGELLQVLAGSPTSLLLNRRADIALATRAPGVHLSSSADDLTPSQVHTLYRQSGLPPPIVSVSCHTLADLDRLQGEPVAVILFGPVFEKSVREQIVQTGTGLDLLQQACLKASPIPVLALGGITPANTPACLTAGAGGIAGIRYFRLRSST